MSVNLFQHGKKSVWSRQNAGVEGRASKDLAEKEEEDNVMDRSRWVCVERIQAFRLI